MKQFLLTALTMGGLFVLSSFTFHGSPNMRVPGGPAWTVSQYQLDRTFRTTIPNAAMPVTNQLPPSGGIIITNLHAYGGNFTVTIAINGVAEQFDLWGPNNQQNAVQYQLNPPIIARPGDTITINQGPGGGTGSPVLVVGGYTTLPGET